MFDESGDGKGPLKIPFNRSLLGLVAAPDGPGGSKFET